MLNLNDLKTKFVKTTITAAVQCGGNRRLEMSAASHERGSDGWNFPERGFIDEEILI